MPHMSPMNWLAIFSLVFVCLMTMIISLEYKNPSIKK